MDTVSTPPAVYQSAANSPSPARSVHSPYAVDPCLQSSSPGYHPYPPHTPVPHRGIATCRAASELSCREQTQQRQRPAVHLSPQAAVGNEPAHPDVPFPLPGARCGPPIEELVGRVKSGQRASPEWRARWWVWCDANGGTRDPAKLSYWELCMAVAQCGEPPLEATPFAGERKPDRPSYPQPQPAETPFHASLVHKIKVGQKLSDDWKDRWWMWCDQRALSTYDPTRHSLAQLMDAVATIGNPPEIENAQENGEKDRLADNIRALQSTDAAFKAAWGDFCDLHGKGRRDPARHTLSFLARAATYLKRADLVN
ncbi:hypothetical protein DIPPA_18680 [Diplonema papillatum]|nr:hypothetical protein DIPPA_18680 [Diplonema papillatum]